MPLRNEEIFPAIIVVIEQMRAPTGKSESRATHARRVGHILEAAFAVVVKEDVRDALKIVGMAVGPQARFLFSTIAVVPEAPIHITGHEEVEVAVIVVIEKPGARTPSASDNSGAFRYVGERAVPIVMVERVPAIACYVDVFKAIIVVVAHRHTHRI